MSIWNTELRLCRETGMLDGYAIPPTTSASTVYNFFNDKVYKTFTEYSIIRPEKRSKFGWNVSGVHVGLEYDQCSLCDYVMFVNNDIAPNLWIYAKVVEIEYVSTNGSRIHFDIDWYHTYAHRIRFKRCFVERHHAPSNERYNQYLLPEPFKVPVHLHDINQITTRAVGIEEANEELEDVGAYALAGPAGVDGAIPSLTGSTIYGEPIAAWAKSYPDKLSAFTDLLINAGVVGAAGVIGVNLQLIHTMSIVPKVLHQNPNNGMHYYMSIMRPQRDEYLRSDGIPIQNWKCLTFPYLYWSVVSGTGDTLNINPAEGYDLTAGSGSYDIVIHLTGAFPCQAICTRGIGNNYNTYVAGPYYPMFSMQGNASFAELVGNVIKAGVLVTGAASAVAGSYSAGFGGAGAGKFIPTISEGAKIIAGTEGTSANAWLSTGLAIEPFNAGGGGSIATTSLYNKLLYKFDFFEARPHNDDLTALDDFFNRYGYNVSRLMTPNPTQRPFYTYIQTRDAVVVGQCPKSAINYTQNMLNRGVTFWNIQNGATVGEFPVINR